MDEEYTNESHYIVCNFRGEEMWVDEFSVMQLPVVAQIVIFVSRRKVTTIFVIIGVAPRHSK